ncbi:MAG: helix-turn-helix domain-containing protein [Acidobacteriota bacterium]
MRTLLVDPNEESRDALRRMFSAAGEQVRSVESLDEARRHAAVFAPDVAVVALDAPGGDPIAFIQAAARESGMDVFALVEGGRLDSGVQAMDRGAADFLWRPVSESRVSILLSRLAERRGRERRIEDLRVRLVRSEIAATLTGDSSAWQSALAEVERAAASGDPVLVAGEAGTEQEEAARALHGLSSRGAGPFLRVSSVELPEVPASGHGTIYVPALERRRLETQEALLPLVETPTRFRPVFAINEEPEEAAAAGRIIPSLFAALRDRIVHLPPLRERGDDVDSIARRLLADIDPTLSFDAEALDALRVHDWPGNVRELRDVVRRSAPLSDGPVIGPTVVLSLLAGPRARRRSRRRKPPVVQIAVGASLADVERRLIQKTLEFARGNKPKTAALLKLSLKTIYNKIKEYGLEH